MRVEKKCNKCNLFKDLSLFNKRKDSPDGYRNQCKDCVNEYSKGYKKDWRKGLKRKSELKSDDVNLKICSSCLESKPRIDFHKERSSKDGLRGQCKKCRSSYSKDYHEKNKERNNVRSRVYGNENRKKLSDYEKQRKKVDPVFKLKKSLRSRVSNFIKRGGYSKQSSLNEVIGCDWEFLKEYISSQFQEGMTWENHGEWHIDHIKPLSSADSSEEVYNLNHYTNLQPLWAEDNLIKNDKVLEQQLRIV